MQKLTKIPLVLASVLASISLVAAPVVVYAEGGSDSNSNDKAMTLQEHQARLSAVKLKVCQQRQAAIDSIMARIADRGQRQLDLFSDIATKVETFASNHNQQPSNYDALVADVNTAHDKAVTVVGAIKTDSANFKCDGSDPKGAATTFKTDLKNEIQALKDYRTAVKNLTVGVKSAKSSTGGNQ